MYTNAGKKATLKYMANNLDEIKFRIPKGQKDILKECANFAGMSMTAFIIEAIQEKADKIGYPIQINQTEKITLKCSQITLRAFTLYYSKY